MHHKPFISVNRVATLLGIHHATAKRMLHSLELPSVMIGRRRLYRTSDVIGPIGAILGHG